MVGGGLYVIQWTLPRHWCLAHVAELPSY